MENKQKPSLESWDDFRGEWIKAEWFQELEITVPVIDADSRWTDEGKAQIVLTIEFEGKPCFFSLNATSQAKVKTVLGKEPKKIIGALLTLERVRVYNPNLKKTVDGLAVKEVKKNGKKRK